MRRNDAKSLNPSSNYMVDALNKGNELAIEELESKSAKILFMTKRVDESLRTDAENLRAFHSTMDNGNSMMQKGVFAIKSITDDPSAMGVMKIALTVFTILCVLYFGGKIILRLRK